MGGPELVALGKAGIIAKLSTLPVLQDGGVLAAAVAKAQVVGVKITTALAAVGVVAGSPEAREFEGLMSLYERLKSVEGLDPWPALKQALSITAGAAKSSNVDAALADLADVSMPETFRSAINADGTVNLDKVPKVEELYQALGAHKEFLSDGSYFWKGGRQGKWDLQNHHSAVQQYTKQLFNLKLNRVPTRTELDDMPAILSFKDLHDGENGTAAFHAILRGVVKANPATDINGILTNLEATYNEWDSTNGSTYWKVAAKWLSNFGIQKS